MQMKSILSRRIEDFERNATRGIEDAFIESGINIVMAQPSSGKTYTARKAIPNAYIVDIDDIQHQVKTLLGVSGWDVIELICDKVTFYQSRDGINMNNDNERHMRVVNSLFIKLILSHVLRYLTERVHKPEMEFYLLAHAPVHLGYLMSAIWEVLPSFSESSVKLHYVYRDTAGAFITEWNKRQEGTGKKNKNLSNQQLVDHYDTWFYRHRAYLDLSFKNFDDGYEVEQLNQSLTVNYLGELSVNLKSFIPLPEGKYLYDVFHKLNIDHSSDE